MSRNALWFERLDERTHQKIQRFVDEESTGRVSLDFKNGRPGALEVKDHSRIGPRASGSPKLDLESGIS